MTIEVQTVPRPEWSPLPDEGCRNVDGKVLIAEKDLVVAMLNFGRDGTIHEHPTGHDIDVVCLEGRGKMSVEGEEMEIAAGQRARWPANKSHRLWTEDGEMLTLMIERLASGEHAS